MGCIRSRSFTRRSALSESTRVPPAIVVGLAVAHWEPAASEQLEVGEPGAPHGAPVGAGSVASGTMKLDLSDTDSGSEESTPLASKLDSPGPVKFCLSSADSDAEDTDAVESGLAENENEWLDVQDLWWTWRDGRQVRQPLLAKTGAGFTTGDDDWHIVN